MSPAVALRWERFRDGPPIPMSRAQTIALVGDPTRGGLYEKVPDPRWEKRNTIELHGDEAFLPVLEDNYLDVARALEPAAREGFRRAEEACPGYIYSVGGHVHRRMRHDTPAKAKARNFKPPLFSLSEHAFVTAFDLNPNDNKAAYFGKGYERPDWCAKTVKWPTKAPEPWSPLWWEIWPRGIPQGVVEAFDSVGYSCGIWWPGSYKDPMHVQYRGRLHYYPTVAPK